MSYTRTPEIPRNHPLAILLERSQKANQLPSCEACRYQAPSPNTQKINGVLVISYECGRGHEFEFDHFCAAWEPKA